MKIHKNIYHADTNIKFTMKCTLGYQNSLCGWYNNKLQRQNRTTSAEKS